MRRDTTVRIEPTIITTKKKQARQSALSENKAKTTHIGLLILQFTERKCVCVWGGDEWTVIAEAAQINLVCVHLENGTNKESPGG